MPLPKPQLDPPFNVVRASHIVLGVADLERSRRFYESMLGLDVTGSSSEFLRLRGMEERNSCSVILQQTGDEPCCERLGFKVGSERDLELAREHFAGIGCPAEYVDSPHLGKVLHASDPTGMPLEFAWHFPQEERILQKYERYRGAHPLRIDHFNCFASDVQGAVDYWNSIGFRVTEYTATDDGEEIWAAWMHRKGSVHDIAFTNGRGPRLHHVAYWVPNPINIIHVCDMMSTAGYLANMERGPGRHGISNAFFLYVRDPDGHRIELYACDYLTVDPDLEPIRWSLTDPRRQTLWGAPAPKSWFEEGSVFRGVPVSEPQLAAQPIIGH